MSSSFFVVSRLVCSRVVTTLKTHHVRRKKTACPSEEISRALLAHQNGLVKTTVIAPAKAETGAAQEVRCMYPFSAKANQLDKRSAVPPTNMEVRVPTGFFVVPLPSATERKKAYQ